MRQHWIFWVVAIAILGVVLVASLLRNGGLLPSPGALYPQAPKMPPAVPEAAADLLARFERILADRAPAVLAGLQPGLPDAQIDALEAQHQFKLPPDLRALYRWRNGTPRDAPLDVFPHHRFVPLDEALAERDALRQQVKAGTPAQQLAYKAFAGHRDAWLGLIVDGAGDGYFFDPGRSEDQGSFFFCFAEDGGYVFYPAFRNFLAAVIAGHETGVFSFGNRGARTTDFVGAQTLWNRYGAQNDR